MNVCAGAPYCIYGILHEKGFPFDRASASAKICSSTKMYSLLYSERGARRRVCTTRMAPTLIFTFSFILPRSSFTCFLPNILEALCRCFIPGILSICYFLTLAHV